MAARRNSLVNYAIVGLGHIAQVAVLPAFAHAKPNSRVTALVSDDAAKLKALSKKYRIPALFSHDEYDKCLEQVDAVYIALPNSLHAEYTIRRSRWPEPSGEEGLQDVRIVQALYESVRTGRTIAIPPFERTKSPTGRQRIVRPGVRKPKLVKVQSASVD